MAITTVRQQDSGEVADEQDITGGTIDDVTRGCFGAVLTFVLALSAVSGAVWVIFHYLLGAS